MYIFFCNNLYFFVIFINGEVTQISNINDDNMLTIKNIKNIYDNNMCDEKGITNNDNTYILNNKSLLKKKKEKRYTDDHNNNNNDHDDKIFERILKNVECNKVNRHLYEQDEQVDKYKYNEHFINYLKNNKKKI